MSEKSFKKSEFKRTIDLGKTDRGQDTDLIRVWRESSGEEKAISLGDINGGLIGDYVPYTGAVDDVDLGEKGISTGYVKYDTTPTSTPTDQGTSYWDIDDNTLAIIMNGTTLKVGEDQYYPVKNQTGVLIPKGTAVRFAGTLGSSGRLLIAPFIADGSVPSSRFMGVTSEDIDNGEDGKVMWFGRIRGLNTNAFNEGDILYASTTVAGGFQTTTPTPPNNIVEVCAVVHKSASNGIIFVRPSFITPSITINPLTPNGLSISGTQVLTIGLASTSDTGALSSTDWNTFNGKIGGSLTSGRIPFATGTNTLSDDSGLTWDNVNKRLLISPTNTGAETTNINLLNLSTTASTAIRIKFTPSTDVTSGIGGAIRVVRLNTPLNGASEMIFAVSEATTTGQADRWKITSVGFLEGVGSARIRVPSGSTLTLSDSTVDNIVLVSSRVGVLTNSPTNTLDVNGTARIRTISNLGSAATSVLVPSATGVVSLRTATQLLADMGGIGGTIASGQVAFGTGVNTVGGDSDFVWDSVNNRLRINTTDTGANLSIATSLNVLNASVLFRCAVGADFAAIGTSTAHSLILRTNLTERINISATGVINLVSDSVGVATSVPTNTLDVNGTARIRTISNLGTAATSVLVPSATGVVSLRTATELLVDMGGISGTIASGQVAFGTGLNTVGGDGGLTWDNVNKRLQFGNFASPPHITTSGLDLFIFTDFATGRNFQIGSSDRFIRGTLASTIIRTPITIFQAANGAELTRQDSSGNWGFGTNSPTNRIDVNGTARIRTISNLGSAATSVLVPDATGVVSLRTLAELASDGGFVLTTTNQSIAGVKTFTDQVSVTGTFLSLPTALTDRGKLRIFGASSEWAIGNQGSTTFGRLNNTAITFNVPNTATQGFWWGDSGHTASQGAMSLTSGGDLTVANSLRLGYGESDTEDTVSYGFDHNGTVRLAAIPSGTIVDSLGLDSNNQVVKGSVASVSLKTANDTTLGAMQYNGTTRDDGSLYGGTDVPNGSVLLNYGGKFRSNDLIAVNFVQGGTFRTGEISPITSINNGSFFGISVPTDSTTIITVITSSASTNTHATVVATDSNGTISTTVLHSNNLTVTVAAGSVRFTNNSGSTLDFNVNQLRLI
jgi:hypothetical protein